MIINPKNHGQPGRRTNLAGKRALQTLLLILLPLTGGQAWGANGDTTDWGVVSTDEETTFYFGNIHDSNFTDAYNFSLTGDGDSAYQTTVTYDTCARGCGNPAFSVGIYDANGSLIDSSGQATLSSGNYTFQVKATGMGSGNEVTYTGSMTFSPVSAVPEPADWLLMLSGSAFLIWAVRRRKIADGERVVWAS